jgi:putative PIN family toxin of toxin-antitoxin system
VKAVLDSNVLVRAVLSDAGPPGSILRAWRNGSFQLVISLPLLSELEAVLSRPRIAKRTRWSGRERIAFLVALSESAMLVAPGEEIKLIDSDPADNRVLEAAAQAGADYIVSGDRHLLDLHSYEGIDIVTPARFAAVLSTSP